MFEECFELEYLDLSNFNTSNVVDMSFMFNKCYKLKEIKGINNFNIKKVNNMIEMFSDCFSLKNNSGLLSQLNN
jgi:surface protein